MCSTGRQILVRSPTFRYWPTDGCEVARKLASARIPHHSGHSAPHTTTREPDWAKLHVLWVLRSHAISIMLMHVHRIPRERVDPRPRWSSEKGRRTAVCVSPAPRYDCRSPSTARHSSGDETL
jgi:hypothetical protein